MSLDLTGRRWPEAPRSSERLAVAEALQSQVWTGGQFTELVEQQMTELTGARHCVTFNSCTSALHAVLASDQYASTTGRIYTTPLTFVGTVTGAGHLGYDIEYRDVHPDTLNLNLPPANPLPVYNGRILAVDLHGVPHSIDRDQVITDACQSLGTTIGGKHLGAHGTHCWSFSSAKLIAAPDGGAVTTNNAALAALLRRQRDYGVRTQTVPGRSNGMMMHRADGHNWRPSELTMALVAARLEILQWDRDSTDGNLSARAYRVGTRLHEAIDLAGLWRQQTRPNTRVAWHKIRIGPPNWQEHSGVHAANELGHRLEAAGIPVHRWGAIPLHRHPAYFKPTSFPVAEAAARSTFCLGTEDCPPLTWTPEEVEQVCDTIIKIGKTVSV